MDTVKVRIEGLGEYVYEKNTLLYEISKELKQKNIVGAKMNNSLVSLSSAVKQDCHIKFIDFCDLAGYKIYQAGLKFIFEVALKETYPDFEVEYEHSVPKGILAEIKGNRALTGEDIAKIKGVMSKIIDEDIRFEKYTVEKKDIIEYFSSNNELEKALNIQNLNEDVVRIYKLKNFLNYYYTEMPYSTKSIDKFDIIYLGKNKIVFIFPSSRTNGQVPEYVHYGNIIDNFLEGKEWLNKMKVPYLADLNKLVSDCKISNLIEANELLSWKEGPKLAAEA